MSSTVDDVAADYLRRLETALKGLPSARRRQLVAEIAEHLGEARAELAPDDEAGMRELLDRIGRPEDIAAAAVAGEPRARRWGRGRLTLAGAAAVVLVASLVTALVVARPGKPTVVAAGAPVPPSVSVSHPATVAPSAPSITTPAATTPPATTPPRVTTTQPVQAQAPAVAVRTPGKPPIRSGIYVNGVDGTPHYFVSLTSTGSGTVSGDVDFLFQDGQTEVAFTFTGTIRNGMMTIYPANVQNDPRIVNHVPSVLSAEAAQDAFGLGECTGYLPGTESLTDCSFSYSPDGIGGPPGN